MNPEPSTPAEDTVAFLQEAQRNSLPVLIPGAFERRARVPAAALSQPVAARVPQAHIAAVSDRGRLERELEGGGAPSQRAGPGTISARLWQSMIHPLQLPHIWRRLPQTP